MPTEKWRESNAKRLLKEDITAGAVTPNMTAAEVYAMRPEHREYPKKNFTTNLRNLRNSIADYISRIDAAVINWRNSRAKELLKQDVLSGLVTADMKPAVVHEMHEECKEFAKKNFSTNLRNLRAVVDENRARMKGDLEAYEFDRLALAVTFLAEEVPWHWSEAKGLLKQDMKEGKHLSMDKKELYESRDEYKVYPLKKFRDHIYQAEKKEMKKAFRFEKKKTRAPTKARAENRYDDDAQVVVDMLSRLKVN